MGVVCVQASELQALQERLESQAAAAKHRPAMARGSFAPPQVGVLSHHHRLQEGSSLLSVSCVAAVAGKDIDSVKVVVCGCGAAGFT